MNNPVLPMDGMHYCDILVRPIGGKGKMTMLLWSYSEPSAIILMMHIQ
mgnify:CR=1 FL=1